MVDWNGLLNWTVKISEEEKSKQGVNITPHEFKPMSEEDVKWLEAALESTCGVNEMKEILKILDKLKEPEGDEKNMDERLNSLEDLLSLIDGLENGRNIVRAKRFDEIIQYFYSTKFKPVKLMLANILTSMLQNDKYVQEAAIELGLFKQVLVALNENEDAELTDKYVYLLTGLLYGEYEKPKRLLLEEFDGVRLLNNLLIKNSLNGKIFRRLLSILKELSRIEEKESDNVNTRFILIDKIKEINLQALLLNYLDSTDYKNENDFEVRNILLDIFINIVRVYDSLEEIYKVIENLNKKLAESKIETEKEEKLHLVHVIKRLKDEFTNYKQNIQNNDDTQSSSNVQVLENGNMAIRLKD
jgi:hypothetical protein